MSSVTDDAGHRPGTEQWWADPGTVVLVVGEGKAGKSTLVNELCGIPLSEFAAGALTAFINTYRLGPNAARVRRHGSTEGMRTSPAQAHRIAAEERARDGLAEISWARPDLELLSGVTVVDTPDLSRALGPSGEVKEVWAEWFGRADVVIWAFSAHEMDAPETRAAFETIVRLFDQPIVPVATKVDRLTPEMRATLSARFERTYGSFRAEVLMTPVRPYIAAETSWAAPTGLDALTEDLRHLTGGRPIRANQVLRNDRQARLDAPEDHESSVPGSTHGAESCVPNPPTPPLKPLDVAAVPKVRAALDAAVRDFGHQEYRKQMDDRDRDSELGALIMVIGEGNFGKSTLVNALCGEPVAKTGAVPLTFKIDVHRVGPEGAVVRRENEVIGTRCGIEEAEGISAAEEVRLKAEKKGISSGEERLAEIVWSRPSLRLPAGCALVDTPGIAQALAGAAKGKSIATVLGAAYEVDAVWAYWFHRADVVLWAFAANKLESAETKSALTAALRLFAKKIVPVATKADLLSPEERASLPERFARTYGEELAGRDVAPLRLVVAGGKSDEVGLGIEELRADLRDAAEERARADRQFVTDLATGLKTLVTDSATDTVDGVREIALVGDELVPALDTVVDRATQSARQALQSALSDVLSSLCPAAARIVRETNAGREPWASEEKIRALCQEALAQAVERADLGAIVPDRLQSAGPEIEALAERIAATRTVRVTSFRASTGTVHERMPLKFRMDASVPRTSYQFSFSARLPARGFLAGAWDFIKQLFGGEASPKFSESDLMQGFGAALTFPSGDFDGATKHLKSAYARQLVTGIDEGMKAYFGRIGEDPRQMLTLADDHLGTLTRASNEPTPPKFRPRAMYWMTLAPGGAGVPLPGDRIVGLRDSLVRKARESAAEYRPDEPRPFTDRYALSHPVDRERFEAAGRLSRDAETSIDLPRASSAWLREVLTKTSPNLEEVGDEHAWRTAVTDLALARARRFLDRLFARRNATAGEVLVPTLVEEPEVHRIKWLTTMADIVDLKWSWKEIAGRDGETQIAYRVDPTGPSFASFVRGGFDRVFAKDFRYACTEVMRKAIDEAAAKAGEFLKPSRLPSDEIDLLYASACDATRSSLSWNAKVSVTYICRNGRPLATYHAAELQQRDQVLASEPPDAALSVLLSHARKGFGWVASALTLGLISTYFVLGWVGWVVSFSSLASAFISMYFIFGWVGWAVSLGVTLLVALLVARAAVVHAVSESKSEFETRRTSLLNDTEQYIAQGSTEFLTACDLLYADILSEGVTKLWAQALAQFPENIPADLDDRLAKAVNFSVVQRPLQRLALEVGHQGEGMSSQDIKAILAG